MTSLTREGDVMILDLGEGEHRFNGSTLDAIESCLDEVEAAAPCALVTSARGKVWSNGLDLEWLSQQGEGAMRFVDRVQELLARTLELPVPTVAALQGHVFAAGAMFALAHDQRVMRADRGFFCLPEVDIGLPFTPGMSALIASRLPVATALEAMTTGRRYGGEQAAAAGIVDEAAEQQQVLARALERAAALTGKDPATLRTIKQRLHERPLAALRGQLAAESIV